MNRRSNWIASSAIAAIIIAAGSGIVLGGGSNETDTPLTDSALEQAAAAALAHGGGTVIESEVGDDGAAYGIEIRLDAGSTVEVSVDQTFNVIGSQVDEDGSSVQDGGSDN